MEEGILQVKGGRLYFVVPGITSIPLQQETTLEIYLGQYWIAGTFHSHKQGDASPLELQLRCHPPSEQPSFCGLLSGMRARVYLEEVLTPPLPPQELVGLQHLDAFHQPATTLEHEETQQA
ncbi:MAG TPA: hypothetical protein VL485_02985 [Ktedonobacteraceae bacterium]|nr:hypothetical protein [Ktedonobacteraceae bacterium]